MTLPVPSAATWFTNALITAALMDANVVGPINALNTAVVGLNGAGTAYTPTLNATTTNPTLGTGNSVTGRYVQVGDLVFAHAEIIFGSSGTNAGSGQYSISLPVAAHNPSNLCIIGHGRIVCAGLTTRVTATLGSSGTMQIKYVSASVNGTETNVDNTHPGAWTANDDLRLAFFYEAA